MEHVADVAVHVDEPETLAALGQLLLRGQKHAEARTGYVVELGEIDGLRIFQAEKDLSRLFCLRCVEPSREDNFVVFTNRDLHHGRVARLRRVTVAIRSW